MTTILEIDDRLVEEARSIGCHRTGNDVVTEALEEYIQRRKQQQVVTLFGQVEFDSTYDYKGQRNKK